jgi:hypothetical protein
MLRRDLFGLAPQRCPSQERAAVGPVGSAVDELAAAVPLSSHHLVPGGIVADDDVRPLVRVREQGNVLHELIPRNGALHEQCLSRLGSVGEVLDCGLGVGGGRSGEGESEDEEEKENASQGHRSSCNAFRKSVYVKPGATRIKAPLQEVARDTWKKYHICITFPGECFGCVLVGVSKAHVFIGF